MTRHRGTLRPRPVSFRAMRTLWIALLVALLPLRGWVGDAMAVGMVASPHAAAAVAMAHDCPHGTPTHGASGDARHQGAGHTTEHAHNQVESPVAVGEHSAASAHLLCDVCNGPALSTGATPAASGAVGQGLRIERKQAFASLAPSLVVKPPIA